MTTREKIESIWDNLGYKQKPVGGFIFEALEALVQQERAAEGARVRYLILPIDAPPEGIYRVSFDGFARYEDGRMTDIMTRNVKPLTAEGNKGTVGRLYGVTYLHDHKINSAGETISTEGCEECEGKE